MVIEAAAAGVPMIAANVGGIPEIFDTHTGALFPPGTGAAIATAIKTELDEPATALARAQAMRERIARHFSQDAMVEGIIEGYRAAFAKR